MNLLVNGSTTASAQMRGYRSQTAQTLLDLLRPGDAISDIGWEQLERLPAWTLLKTQDLLGVSREIGMVVLAPALKKSIDGTLLKTVSSKVDASFLRRLISSESVDDASVNSKGIRHFREDPVEAIEQAGAAVLLSTIENKTLVDILARRFKGSHEMIDSQLATNFVEQAEELKAPSIAKVNPVNTWENNSANASVSAPESTPLEKRRAARTNSRARVAAA